MDHDDVSTKSLSSSSELSNVFHLLPPQPTASSTAAKAMNNHRKTHHKIANQKPQIPTAATEDGQSSSTSNYLHLIWFSLVASFVKLLLVPAYHSTDFEVHRNWLAITHSLPLSQWYSDETSPWTLDYPPFFAHFEHLLSLFASIVDPNMVHLTNGLDYKSQFTVLFQRVSVILSDVVLFYGIYKITRKFDPKERFLIWVLVIWSPGLIIVDHLHFQYNGFLLGMLLLSLAALEDGKDLMGGFLFAVLLCFKHLFAVAGPVYFVYLLRHYCRGGLFRGFGKLVAMGSVVLAVFAVAYWPFVYYGQVLFFSSLHEFVSNCTARLSLELFLIFIWCHQKNTDYSRVIFAVDKVDNLLKILVYNQL